MPPPLCRLPLVLCWAGIIAGALGCGGNPDSGPKPADPAADAAKLASMRAAEIAEKQKSAKSTARTYLDALRSGNYRSAYATLSPAYRKVIVADVDLKDEPEKFQQKLEEWMTSTKFKGGSWIIKEEVSHNEKAFSFHGTVRLKTSPDGTVKTPHETTFNLKLVDEGSENWKVSEFSVGDFEPVEDKK